MQKEPLSKVDTAWLRMEEPTNLMMITGIMLLSEPMNIERFKTTIERRFLSFKRFRQRAVDNPRGAYWEIDPDFDIDLHIRRSALPGTADLAELQDYVGDLASTPLDKSRPLWQFHLVENYRGGQVLVTRIHHCIADGIALIQVLLSLTDPGPDPRPSAHDSRTWRTRRLSESNIFKRLTSPAREGFAFLGAIGQKTVEETLSLIGDPERVGVYAREAAEIAAELANSLSLPNDPETRFRGSLGRRKQVAWAEPISLADVKAISKGLGCTVNDLLIAAVTGALHGYLTDLGEPPEKSLEIRVTVPVNLRPLEHAAELGNHFGLVFLPLPVGEVNPLMRVLKVSQNMNKLKSSRQAAVAFGLLAALGMGPSGLQKPALSALSKKATAVLTNVPGPQQPLYIAGVPIGEMMFWVPQNGTIGIGISILSYNNKVFFGLIADRKLIPHPDEVIRRFKPEFEQLLYMVLLADPDAPLKVEDVEGLLGQ
nr:putative wax ester synthase/acyl-CoA:diacylglycerol acyltransferase [uncultured bacterium]